MKLPEISYDARDNILWVDHPQAIYLGTRQEIDAYFQACFQFWRKRCSPKKVFIVVSYDNFTYNHEEQPAYVAALTQVLRDCAETVVRYGGTLDQRTASRSHAMHLHTPSNLYATRDEAVRVVRGLRDGSITQKTG